MKTKTCHDCANCAAQTVIATCKHIGVVTGNVLACSKFEPKPMTNGDKIRAMSNEEFSYFICRQLRAAIQTPDVVDVDYELRVIDWLNAPAGRKRGDGKMKCYHCEHYDNKTDICDVDGKVVINPWSDAGCDRLGCAGCIFSSDKELKIEMANNPHIFEALDKLETESGFTMSMTGKKIKERIK